MNDAPLHTLVPLGLGFIAYFVMHSLLASLWLKQKVLRRWPRIMPAYRLIFNLLSVILLLPLIWLMHQNPGALIWQWPGMLSGLMKGLTFAAILGFFWSLKSYDNGVFLGWTQWRNRHMDSTDPDSLHISTLHRFVRHPWYFFFLVIMWAQDLHLAQFVVYGLITGYFIVGSRLEENKLIAHYGEPYRKYRRQVPGLFPLPWRWMSAKAAAALVQQASR
ncbi:MAG: hypothetical protein GXP17_04675 [Gammaproteobacteria bacterium]|nr:hypothetical protein [Gammaproteobacteria bacterium]